MKLLNLFILFLLLTGCSSKKNINNIINQKPNIIFIMSDDHAVNAISAYGNSINKTPNIDRIADEGIKFSRELPDLLETLAGEVKKTRKK